jgi:hypothetical protein
MIVSSGLMVLIVVILIVQNKDCRIKSNDYHILIFWRLVGVSAKSNQAITINVSF